MGDGATNAKGADASKAAGRFGVDRCGLSPKRHGSGAASGGIATGLAHDGIVLPEAIVSPVGSPTPTPAATPRAARSFQSRRKEGIHDAQQRIRCGLAPRELQAKRQQPQHARRWLRVPAVCLHTAHVQSICGARSEQHRHEGSGLNGVAQRGTGPMRFQRRGPGVGARQVEGKLEQLLLCFAVRRGQARAGAVGTHGLGGCHQRYLRSDAITIGDGSWLQRHRNARLRPTVTVGASVKGMAMAAG